ncbi:hypothetical protein AKO1_012811 [Acrasis kona]|uniref:Metal-dependent hydrolase n=1 Tax=Acrasis kona TaxID=1008807 RepID=A0AAW2YWZ6_9EUKA
MFSGHLGFAYLLKLLPVTNNISLGTLFLAAQWPDFLLGLTLILGHDWGSYDPSLAGKTFPFKTHLPISHSLFGWLLGIGFLAVFQAFWRRCVTLSEIVTLSVGALSHWLLDVLVHRGSIPIFPTSNDPSNFVGLSLWDLPNSTVFGLEMAILFLPLLLLLITGRLKLGAAASVSLLILIIIHVVFQYNSNFIAPFSTDNMLSKDNGPVFLGLMVVLGLLCHFSDNNSTQDVTSKVKTN